MKYVLFILAFISFSFSGRSEDTNFSIVAKVNEDIISVYDVNSRITLMIKGANIENSEENRQKISSQVLKMLIDEKLKLQEAKKLNIEIIDADLQSAYEQIEKNNKMEPGALKSNIEKDGIDFSTLEAQIRTQVAWIKLMEKTVKPTITISEKEIDEELDKIKASVGKPEYLIYEIFLPTTSRMDEGKILQDMGKIRSLITDKKAPFEAVAQQFSASASAAKGGSLGYIALGALEPELDETILRMAVNEISEPIRTDSGYYLLLLKDKRTLNADQVPDRIKVRAKIGNKRLSIMEKNKLNSLRRRAVIDIVK